MCFKRGFPTALISDALAAQGAIAMGALGLDASLVCYAPSGCCLPQTAARLRPQLVQPPGRCLLTSSSPVPQVCTAAQAERCRAAVCKLTHNLEQMDCLHSAADDKPAPSADAAAALTAMATKAMGGGRRLLRGGAEPNRNTAPGMNDMMAQAMEALNFVASASSTASLRKTLPLSCVFPLPLWLRQCRFLAVSHGLSSSKMA